MSPPIYTPDGSEVSEIVLPDGSTASEVIGPDGNVVFEAGADIPDSVLYQFRREDISATDGATSWTWPEQEQSDDMSINGATYDSSLFGGEGGVSPDGTDDYGETSTMGTFGSNMDTDFAVAFRFKTSSTGAFCGVVGPSGNEFAIGNDDFGNVPSGRLYLSLNGSGGRWITYSNSSVDDGTDYIAIINKVGQNDTDIEFYIGSPDTEDGTNLERNDGFGAPQDFTYPMNYFAKTVEGTPERHISGNFGGFLWFNNSLTQSERNSVFDILQ